MGALISNCGKYRTYLTRRISGIPNDETLLFIMLNPSTADAELDDPTIRKCKGFCEQLNFGRLAVANLFDYRATDPSVLKTIEKPCSDHNIDILLDAAHKASMVICAWGTKGALHGQGEYVLRKLGKNGITTHALELTKENHPKHPLYISYSKKPFVFYGAIAG